MTVATASATDELVRPVVSGVYRSLAEPAETYVLEVRPAFRLAVERESGTWTVVDRATGIYGAGSEPSEALTDFRRAVVEHLDVLERQESLSGDLAAQLRYLRERV